MNAATFWQSVEATGCCWLWTRSVISGPRGGYGQLRWEGRMRKAHHVAWLLLVGDLPEGEPDHLCRIRRCVNPDHLRWGTRSANMRSSPLIGGKTHCVHGHSLADAMILKRNGARVCRECARIKRSTPEARAYHRAYSQKQRADQANR